MAEIHVQKKRPVWPWVILGLIVLAILIWMFTGRTPRQEAITAPPVTTAPVTTPAPAAAPPAMLGVAEGPVAQFLQHAQQDAAQQAGVGHEYTADGLRRLADALEVIAQRDQVVDASLSQHVRVMRERAESMQREPTSEAHARQAHEGMASAAAAMQILQQRHPGTQPQVAQVEQAAAAVQPEGQLLEQMPQVQQFFQRSAEVVRGMATV